MDPLKQMMTSLSYSTSSLLRVIVTVFSSASSFNGNVAQWDVGQVTDMSYSESFYHKDDCTTQSYTRTRTCIHAPTTVSVQPMRERQRDRLVPANRGRSQETRQKGPQPGRGAIHGWKGAELEL